MNLNRIPKCRIEGSMLKNEKQKNGTALEIPCTMAQRTTAISTASTAGLWS